MTVRVGEVKVPLIERGSGPPILFLHGVPDSGDMWLEVISRLQDRFRCLAPDMPGLARSTAPRNFDLSLDNRARFVDDLLKALGIAGPINLVMHDFGGTYGLPWACLHPEKVRRVVISQLNFFPDYRWHSNARMFRTPFLGELSMAMVNESLFLRSMRSGAPGLTDEQKRGQFRLSMSKPAVRRMILRLYRSTNPGDFAAWQDRLRAMVARVPTCVIWGDKDPFITPDFAERFGAKEVHHLAGSGHWPPLEEPDEVARILGDFFAGE